jgi:hypothetical protein
VPGSCAGGNALVTAGVGDEFVRLAVRRNRGWPWPEDSWGLTPMYGEGGWCRRCGVPLEPQTGDLVLQRKGLTTLAGAWVPYWRHDVVCLEADLAERASTPRRRMRDVSWQGAPPGQARHLVIPTVGPNWFDEGELRAAAAAVHGTPGQECRACGTWRWFPLGPDRQPPVQVQAEWQQYDVVASPEWFGDGWKTFRRVLFRRQLAELLVEASPKDFTLS